MDADTIGGSRVAPMIWSICTPIIFIIGIVGNTLTILVLNRRTKLSSTTVYLTAMAIADLFHVFFGLPRWVILYNFNYDIRVSSVFACKTHLWLLYALGRISASYLIALTVERVWSLSKPYTVRVFCSVNRAVFICIGILLFWLACNAHIVYGFDLRYISTAEEHQNLNISNATDQVEFANLTSSKDKSNNGTARLAQCVQIDDDAYNTYYDEVQGYVAFATYNGMTLAVCTTAGIYIVWKLMKNNQIRKTLHQNGSSHGSRANQVTFMLLAVNIVFLVSSTPIGIFLIIRNDIVNEAMTPTQEIAWAVFCMLHYLNHAINFILYFLSGTRFRKTFYDFFRCGRSERQPDRLSTDRVATIGNRESVTLSHSGNYFSPI